MKITGQQTIEKILLNEFKHGQKLRFKDKEYSYDTNFRDFINEIGKRQYTLIYENNMTLKDFLESEFELIEEYKTDYTERCIDVDVRNKINELVRAVNKLIKEREEK